MNTITDFSTVSSTIGGKFLRIAARYQQNGTLVAVRIYASTSFNTVWISPEGHVLHVNTSTNTLTVTNAVAAVALNHLNQTYDGTAKSASATTTPAGLTVNFTYNGSATAPTNAGS